MVVRLFLRGRYYLFERASDDISCSSSSFFCLLSLSLPISYSWYPGQNKARVLFGGKWLRHSSTSNPEPGRH